MNSQAVRNWMDRNKITPEQLAGMLKVSFYTVRNILQGKTVSEPVIELLSLKSGIPVETLKASKKRA